MNKAEPCNLAWLRFVCRQVDGGTAVQKADCRAWTCFADIYEKGQKEIFPADVAGNKIRLCSVTIFCDNNY